MAMSGLQIQSNFSFSAGPMGEDSAVGSHITTRSLPPFPIKKYQHNDYARAKVWLLKDLNPTQDFQNCHPGDLLSGFVRITNWCAKTH